MLGATKAYEVHRERQEVRGRRNAYSDPEVVLHLSGHVLRQGIACRAATVG